MMNSWLTQQELLTRREMLGRWALSGLALGIGSSAAFAAPPPTPSAALSASSFAAEGARLTAACMAHFWDPHSQMFRAPVLSAETVPSDALHDRGYTFWPSLIALHALVAGEAQQPGQYAAQIAAVYAGLEQYFSPELQAYTAWVHFPGNRDAYYDDNSWAVTVLTEASHACRRTDSAHAAAYLARAETIMARFVVPGAAGPPGGMPWGVDPAKPNTSDRGTSSTAGSALAALMLARAGVKAAFYTGWGLGLLAWLDRRLLDTDGLIMDALVPNASTPPGWKPRRIKWTYNTGVPMRAYAEHYRLTKHPHSLARAEQLARAAINLQGALWDQAAHDPSKRFFWDSIYFVQYLADGLRQAAEITPDTQLAVAVSEATTRAAHYARAFLRDPADDFYWRSFRLYAIGPAQHAQWERWTGQAVAPAYDPSERSQDPKHAALPVTERPLVKTLLANAAAARLFRLAAR